ncbi:phosphoenolpyruvate carboxykinase (ATP) [Dethiobacter alkaliphilus]|uniref:Phosphoenolpyruvate carboxykinase (ATP) n=1 Tax=Dethiobacter alkaliphilus AHT 1 TaxID=555088 RepID=C0GJ81_DETAL|nr:phosphoenolpyruvate carboxykinase (ATP) [Dethiobacter alkaliphilus]EEG76566.1 Phosphoenolpyruvate carboxykinase (ATP) [Dethiobacter alkaliphilus AHT 1]
MKANAQVDGDNNLIEPKRAQRNLSVMQLVDAALAGEEGVLTSTGALRALTGEYTGRSPKDKFIVDEPSIRSQIDWNNNKKLAPEYFQRIYAMVMDYVREHDMYVFDGFAGADDKYRVPIRVINQYAWHNLFAQQLFICPTNEELAKHCPQFTVIDIPELKADPEVHGTNSEAFIIISFEKRVVLIGGTEYAGEMKKSVFSVLNCLLPSQGVLPMHCSANVGKDEDVALFFGLSGTGKTTLSADPERFLVGDDEHGWSDRGIFNFEGGCYAKCIDLKEEKEPQIWGAIKFGSVLENVALHPETRVADYADSSITENTRAAYPIEHIPGAVVPGIAGHPNVIVFLTADAFGVLPPVARLTKEQAMYHFLSGYTSKLAGTERGVTEPEATFSACFGAPFLPLSPGVYAEMLGEKVESHNARVYLVNTGWCGGPYGVGRRIDLDYTRAIITAILNGSIEESGFTADEVFNILVPETVEGVPDRLLQPREAWENKEEYDARAADLAARFADNFTKFTDVSKEVRSAGPKTK